MISESRSIFTAVGATFVVLFRNTPTSPGGRYKKGTKQSCTAVSKMHCEANKEFTRAPNKKYNVYKGQDHKEIRQTIEEKACHKKSTQSF